MAAKPAERAAGDTGHLSKECLFRVAIGQFAGLICTQFRLANHSLPERAAESSMGVVAC